jgi:hypothetical protein
MDFDLEAPVNNYFVFGECEDTIYCVTPTPPLFPSEPIQVAKYLTKHLKKDSILIILIISPKEYEIQILSHSNKTMDDLRKQANNMEPSTQYHAIIGGNLIHARKIAGKLDSKTFEFYKRTITTLKK